MPITPFFQSARSSRVALLSAPILLLLVALWAKASISAGDASEKPIYLHTAAHLTLVKKTDRQVKRRYTGVVSARQHADVGFELGGKVARVLVDEGDIVLEGALLAELDVELLNIEKRRLNAQLVETKARLNLSRNSLKRQRSLKQSGFSSAQRLDELSTEKQSLEAKLVQLEAAQSAVQSRIGKAVLKAPFSGVVTRRFADQGSVAGAGLAIVRLQQQGQMEAYVGVPVKGIEKLLPGLVMSVQLHDEIFDAVVLAIGADIHPVTRTVSVRLALPEAFKGIDGDLIYLNVEETVQGEGYWVPVGAITDGVRGMWRAYALVPNSSEAIAATTSTFKIEARDIQVEYASESHVFIKGAIEPGEIIVDGGLHRFAPGQTVLLSDKG